jgi:hypothetical protein
VGTYPELTVSRPVKKRTFHEGGQTLTLHDRGSHLELAIGHVPILSSGALGTERSFGRLASSLSGQEKPRILVGGLGFGATVEGVGQSVGARAEIVVVERLSTVIKLARGELSTMTGDVLADARVRIVRGDVVDVIARERELDAILLDVDNGPEWASFPENERLYSDDGLRSAMRALKTGGFYAVWSGYPADAFVGRLSRAGFEASTIELEEKGRIQARAYVGVKRG